MLLAELITEEFTKLKSGRNIPELWAGDSVQISKLPFIYSKEVDVINGVVIGVPIEVDRKIIFIRGKELNA